MYGAEGRFKLFHERDLEEYLKENDRKIQSHIEKQSEDYILNVNETEYENFLLSEFNIDIPKIDFEGVYITNYEKKIRPSDFPKQVIVYHLPYVGNSNLLHCKPNPCRIWSTEVFIEDQSICFEVVSEDSEEIMRKADDTINNTKTQLGYVAHQIGVYNGRLKTSIGQSFKARKQSLLDRRHILGSLGVPIKKRENLPQTYAIPTPQIQKSIFAKPVVTASGYKPEPVLDQLIYHDILQTIHDIGKVFERLPSTYSDKSEEELRDHLLLYLEPRYKGSATGETFNKSGKTDILIRYENLNVFIAECKFWQGQKSYLETITQLLGYLTWRDSKAAVIIFVRNKDFSSVLQAVETTTPNHPNYLGYVNKEDESWFNYRLHINDDASREVKLGVLLFHIPPT